MSLIKNFLDMFDEDAKVLMNSYKNNFNEFETYVISSSFRASFIETKNNYILNCEIPNSKKENIIISMNNNILTISGDRNEITNTKEKEGLENVVVFDELPKGSFSRNFKIPSDIIAESISATCNCGLLTVLIPRKPETEPIKININ